MSAYSFVNHRMFVAALGNESAAMPRPEESGARTGPVRAANQPRAGVSASSRSGGSPITGVLLANAMLHGFQPEVS